jgi:hypothetical protein
MKRIHIPAYWQVPIQRIVVVPLLVSPILSAVDSFESGVWGLIWLIWIAVWGVRLLADCVISAVEKNFSIAAQYLAVLLVGMPISVVMISMAGDYIHLAAMYSSYSQEIERSPGAEHTFDWGGSGFAGSAQVNKALVYSPLSPPKFDIAKYQEEIGGYPPHSDVTHLIGKFYVHVMAYN